MFRIRFARLRDAIIKKPLLFASLSALAAALIAAGYLSRKEAELLDVSKPVSVVVASRDIAAGDMVDETRIATREIPKRFVAKGALTDLRAAVGRTALVPIREGAQITPSIARMASHALRLTGAIPVGKRAFSVSVGRGSAVGGLVEPKDSIDIMATFDLGDDGHDGQATFTLVEGVRVLAVGRRMERRIRDDAGRERRSIMAPLAHANSRDLLIVTVAVTPEEAQELALAQSTAHLSLALKPFGEPEDRGDPAPSTLSSIAGDEHQLSPLRRSYREYRGR